MGTGGGEFLLSLGHPYNRISVTEGYEPNLKLCRERLEPLGITVKQVFDDDKLFYDDEQYISNHEHRFLIAGRKKL